MGAILMIVSLVIVYAFFQHAIIADWPAWVLAPVVAFGYRLALRHSTPYGRMWVVLALTALIMVPALAVYTLLQEMIAADWPAWVFTPIIVVSIWLFVAAFFESLDDS